MTVAPSCAVESATVPLAFLGGIAMIKREEVKELYRVCSSTREVHVDLYAYRDATVGNIDAVSVANRDSKRAKVVAILKGQEPLWPAGATRMQVMWMAERTWYACERERRTGLI